MTASKREDSGSPRQNENRSNREIVVHVPDEPLPLTPVVARELLAILIELTEGKRKTEDREEG